MRIKCDNKSLKLLSLVRETKKKIICHGGFVLLFFFFNEKDMQQNLLAGIKSLHPSFSHACRGGGRQYVHAAPPGRNASRVWGGAHDMHEHCRAGWIYTYSHQQIEPVCERKERDPARNDGVRNNGEERGERKAGGTYGTCG